MGRMNGCKTASDKPREGAASGTALCHVPCALCHVPSPESPGTTAAEPCTGCPPRRRCGWQPGASRRRWRAGRVARAAWPRCQSGESCGQRAGAVLRAPPPRCGEGESTPGGGSSPVPEVADEIRVEHPELVSTQVLTEKLLGPAGRRRCLLRGAGWRGPACPPSPSPHAHRVPAHQTPLSRPLSTRWWVRAARSSR